MTYDAWIAAYEQRQRAAVRLVGLPPGEDPIPHVVRGLCRSAVEEMVAAFPELRKVRGHCGPHPHWWCITPDDQIIDPTRAQFDGVAYVYVPYTGPEPVGKCLNCGELVWTADVSTVACSDACARALDADFNAYLSSYR